MLTRLLSTVVALAFLLFGATVAMEAMGLIFRPAPTDPQLRIEAVVAKIEASLDPRDVPSEAEAEGLWPPPEEHAKQPRQPRASTTGSRRRPQLPSAVRGRSSSRPSLRGRIATREARALTHSIGTRAIAGASTDGKDPG